MNASLAKKFKATLQELHRIGGLVESFGEEQQWPPGLLFQVQLAIDEVGTNLVEHGQESDPIVMEIRITSDRQAVVLEILDDGEPFNPLEEAPAPDTESELEDRPVGGLGLFLIQSIMDEERYARVQGKNQLTLVKFRDKK